MSKTLPQLQAEIDYVVACRDAIHAEFGERALDPDAQAKWDEAKGFLSTARAEVAAIEARQAEILADARIPGRTESGDGATAAPAFIVRQDPYDLSDLGYGAPDQAVRSRGLEIVERAAELKPEQQDQAERLVRNLPVEVAVRYAATGSEAYRSAFGKFIASGSTAAMTHDESQAWTRAASLTDNAGGYAVPWIIDPTLILTSDGSSNPFRQISRVVPITNDVWRGVSTAGVTAAFAAEASAITEGSATIAQPTVTAHRAHAQINFSFEIGGDYPGFQSDMVTILQDAKDTLEATKFAVGAGDGSTEPYGIVTALTGTSSEINVSTSEALVVADLYAVEEALGPRFRTNASWVANKAIYNKIRQFDTGGGASLWERLGAGMPSELLGYPAYEASAMDGVWDVAASASNYIMVLGDFRNYVIADRVGMSIEVVPHVVNGDGKLTGQRGLLAWWRVGGDSVNDAAFTMLDLPTAA